MAFITPADMNTHLTQSSITAIAAGDATKLPKAINNAMIEAQSYLSRYTIADIWAASDEDKESLYGNIIDLIKDIAKWKFIKSSNAGIDLEWAEIAYKAAIKGLEKISKELQPGWPLVDETDGPSPFRMGSRVKFNHDAPAQYIDTDNPFE